MSIENLNEEIEQTDEKSISTEKREKALLNEVEKLASEHGWKLDGKKSAEEYIKFALEKLPERGEALTAQNKKLEAKDNELFKMRAMLEEVTAHINKQKDQAYQQALKDLNDQRVHAIHNGDVDLVEEIDKKRTELQSPEQDINNHPAIKSFEERNTSWLTGDSYDELEMQDWVQRHGQLLGKKKLPVEEHMKRLEEDLHKKFSGYFSESESQDVQPVESTDNSRVASHRSGKKTFTYNDLSAAQKEVAKYLKDSGRMDIKDYITQLVEFGDLK